MNSRLNPGYFQHRARQTLLILIRRIGRREEDGDWTCRSSERGMDCWDFALWVASLPFPRLSQFASRGHDGVRQEAQHHAVLFVCEWWDRFMLLPSCFLSFFFDPSGVCLECTVLMGVQFKYMMCILAWVVLRSYFQSDLDSFILDGASRQNHGKEGKWLKRGFVAVIS